MAKVVSQETYDGVVLENIVDFEMSCEEAHTEAQKEFEAQVSVCVPSCSRWEES